MRQLHIAGIKPTKHYAIDTTRTLKSYNFFQAVYLGPFHGMKSSFLTEVDRATWGIFLQSFISHGYVAWQRIPWQSICHHLGVPIMVAVLWGILWF
jgi:hypothetical protein